jgi:hypothetical protein
MLRAWCVSCKLGSDHRRGAPGLQVQHRAWACQVTVYWRYRPWWLPPLSVPGHCPASGLAALSLVWLVCLLACRDLAVPLSVQNAEAMAELASQEKIATLPPWDSDDEEGTTTRRTATKELQ